MNTVPLQVPVGPELVIVLALIVLLFGANRIPKAARSLGEASREIARGRRESDPDAEN
ncbi:twin-arginine translocase TatA/TatE family subunit [Halorubrum sp. Atlit-26R]|uniref:Sec-independent protein translocase subunit TatA/TatB n=1 Tax=Halorubrum sp. Atlit-26R TaxID=2282128 RepID=UPI000EF245E9|nr:twin-arginine translocase TatA/TatE family subunit [Halorubrum sp. Atlit-26R]RLM68635.1 twin-arginine translocase TatA/TatE family subunit [Halorubrum sp. Atlit-26R]